MRPPAHGQFRRFAGYLPRRCVGRLGAQGAERLIGPLTVSQIVGAVVVICLTTVVHFIAARMMRSSGERSAQMTNVGASHLVRAIRRPINVSIWTIGVYVAASPLLSASLSLAPQVLSSEVVSFLVRVGAIAAMVWCLIGISRLFELRLMSWSAGAERGTAHLLAPLFGTTLRIAAIVIGISFGIPLLGIPERDADSVSKLTGLTLIVAVAILLFRVIGIIQDAVLLCFDMTAADNLRARTVWYIHRSRS